ncbi:MAG: hypothetical protein Ta2B_08240 [Termitinemataceae bacterium]|nr:MAG: hypothetical protein Ta2B_08240 [Termitinemataceae bacterium]
MAFTKNDKNINRKGRPKKGQSLTDILNYELDQKDNGQPVIKRQRIAQKLIELAEGGNLQAIIYIMNRIDGTPRQSIETFNRESNIVISFGDENDTEVDDIVTAHRT